MRPLPLRVPHPAEGSRPPTASASPSSASTARTPTTRRETFLEEAPVPYPSYSDGDQGITEAIGASRGLPDTAFYRRNGELCYLKQGPYTEHSELTADIKRFALREECESG